MELVIGLVVATILFYAWCAVFGGFPYRGGGKACPRCDGRGSLGQGHSSYESCPRCNGSGSA
jgi:DnaJ-class molecular chaperone